MQLVPYQYLSDTVQFASQLKRKCLLYPEPASKDNPSFYFPIDFDGPPPKTVTVLCILRKVMSQSSGPRRTDLVWKEYLRKSNLKWFTETRRSGIHTLQSQEDVVALKSILGFAHI